MISIKNRITPEIKKWYCEKITEILEKKWKKIQDGKTRIVYKKKKNIEIKILLPSIEEGITALTKNREMLNLLLTASKKELTEKYDWIRVYVDYCEVVEACRKNEKVIQAAMAEKIPESEKQKKQLQEIQKMEKVLDYFSAGIIDPTDKKVFTEWRVQKLRAAAPENYFKELEAIRNDINEYLEYYIDYSFLTREVRIQLYEKLNIPVCPYCNRSYIQLMKYKYVDENQVEREDNIALADLDHVYPKTVYQLFSLSLWNLVPSCKICNQVLKKARTEIIASPMEYGFDDECRFVLDIKGTSVGGMLGYGNVAGHWEIESNAAHREEIQNSLDVFKLNEQYEYHTDLLKRVLQKRFAEKRFRKALDQLLQEQDFVSVSEEEFHRLLYGVSLSRDKYLEEPFSKMIHDVLEQQSN